ANCSGASPAIIRTVRSLVRQCRDTEPNCVQCSRHVDCCRCRLVAGVSSPLSRGDFSMTAGQVRRRVSLCLRLPTARDEIEIRYDPTDNAPSQPDIATALLMRGPPRMGHPGSSAVFTGDTMKFSLRATIIVAAIFAAVCLSVA